MSDFDRQLVDLISDVTDGSVPHLRELVENYGPELVKRVFSDGFGVVFVDDDEVGVVWVDDDEVAWVTPNYLAADEVLSLIDAPTLSFDYRVHQAPDSVGLEDEPDLVFRYAADEPDAIAELRARNGVK